MSRALKRLSDILRLAGRDYLNEWQMSGCFVLALAAVLGPMMVLFALKFGIVGSMVRDLVEDPRNRELHPVGSGHYDNAWLAALREHPEVAFLAPQTRSIAATMELKSDRAPQIIDAELIPTAAGEPLLTEAIVPTHINEIVLSASAAARLALRAGDDVDGSISRRFRGRSERVHLKLHVIAVARPAAFQREGAFAPLSLVEATEDFRDGHAVPALGWSGETVADSARSFPSFRLYARSIYDVGPLRDLLVGQGIELHTRAADIEVVQSIDRNLSAVFWVIAVIGLVGFSLSLGASLWANVDRKRRELSVLRLVGFRTGDIVWFPVVQSALTAAGGWLAASAIYLGVAYTVNSMLAPQVRPGETICLLLPRHFAIALALTLGAAVIASTLGGLHAARIEPSEGLRDI